MRTPKLEHTHTQRTDTIATEVNVITSFPARAYADTFRLRQQEHARKKATRTTAVRILGLRGLQLRLCLYEQHHSYSFHTETRHLRPSAVHRGGRRATLWHFWSNIRCAPTVPAKRRRATPKKVRQNSEQQRGSVVARTCRLFFEVVRVFFRWHRQGTAGL